MFRRFAKAAATVIPRDKRLQQRLIMASNTSSSNSKDDLSVLLGNLALKDDNKVVVDEKSKALQEHINRTGFRIFECLSDNGYFSWNAPPDANYLDLSSITSTEQLNLSSYLDLNGTPGDLVDHKSIRMPKPFLSNLPPYEHKNQFPRGKIDIVCFHVAAHHRGVNFDDIDFAFGGSTLGMLASCNESDDPYMVTRVPGTPKTIMVAKNKDYIKNLSDVGFQFERLMTGRPMEDASSDEASVEHLHVMNIGDGGSSSDSNKYRVLFRAETDALLEGNPVEIKASNPRYWKTNVMFQMISSGSTNICHGSKGRGSLTGVQVQSLQQVARTALAAPRKKEDLERNILNGMKSIQSQMEGATPGDVFKVSFHKGVLKLLPVRGRSANILPPADIARQLISTRVSS